VLTLNACVPQALAERIVASLVPPAPASGVGASDSSSSAASAAGGQSTGQDAAAVLQRLHALAAEVLGAAVEPDQPLMEVRNKKNEWGCKASQQQVM
jgi:hypothetical protein